MHWMHIRQGRAHRSFCALVWIISGLYVFLQKEGPDGLLTWRAVAFFLPGTLVAALLLGSFGAWAHRALVQALLVTLRPPGGTAMALIRVAGVAVLVSEATAAYSVAAWALARQWEVPSPIIPLRGGGGDMYMHGLLAAGLATAGLLGGCADPALVAPIGQPFSLDLVPYLQLNASSRLDVENWFGQPIARTTLFNRDGVETGESRFAYMHGTAEEGRTEFAFLEVEFDPDGTLKDLLFVHEEDEGPLD
jgi:hypothetical protein